MVDKAIYITKQTKPAQCYTGVAIFQNSTRLQVVRLIYHCQSAAEGAGLALTETLKKYPSEEGWSLIFSDGDLLPEHIIKDLAESRGYRL